MTTGYITVDGSSSKMMAVAESEILDDLGRYIGCLPTVQNINQTINGVGPAISA